MSELCEETAAVLPEPTFEDYVHALTLVAAQGEASSIHVRRFASIFDYWALESERAGVGGVRAFLAAAQKSGLPRLAVVPTSRGGFAAPQSCLYIADDERLAALFQSARGARFVHRDLTQPGVRRVAQLSELLGIPLSSQAVQRESFPVCPLADDFHPLGHVLATVLPLIQRWIFWSRPSLYDAAASVIEGILPLFRMLLCDRVEQTLQLGGDDPTPPQPCAAALDGPCFYVARWAADDYHIVFQEISRALLGGAGDSDLTTFAALLAHTVAANGNAEVLMERAGMWQLFPCCQEAQDLLARSTGSPRKLPETSWVLPLKFGVPETLEQANVELDRSEEADMPDKVDSQAGVLGKRLFEDMSPCPAEPSEPTRQPRCGPTPVWPPPASVWPPPAPVRPPTAPGGGDDGQFGEFGKVRGKFESKMRSHGFFTQGSFDGADCEESSVRSPPPLATCYEGFGQHCQRGDIEGNDGSHWQQVRLGLGTLDRFAGNELIPGPGQSVHDDCLRRSGRDPAEGGGLDVRHDEGDNRLPGQSVHGDCLRRNSKDPGAGDGLDVCHNEGYNRLDPLIGSGAPHPAWLADFIPVRAAYNHDMLMEVPGLDLAAAAALVRCQRCDGFKSAAGAEDGWPVRRTGGAGHQSSSRLGCSSCCGPSWAAGRASFGGERQHRKTRRGLGLLTPQSLSLYCSGKLEGH